MQLTKKTEKISFAGWVALVFSVVLVVLNVLRMINVPVVHDEALTFSEYMPLGVRDIANCIPPSANNHILNTLLAKFITGIFGSSQFFLRLDALLAQVVFLLCSFLISKKLFTNTWSVIAAFLLFNLNPFLFDFWGLCRGYGLSVAFMIASIYFFMRYMKDRSYNLYLSFVFAIAALYSNLALLNYLPALMAVVVFNALFLEKGSTWATFLKRELPAIIAACVITFLLVKDPIHNNMNAHQFYYGGEKGFMDDTIGSLVSDSLFIRNSSLPAIGALSGILILFIVFSDVFLLYKYFKNKETAGIGLALLSWLAIVIPCVSIALQHYLLDTKFLISRTAIFLIPLYIFHVCCFISCISQNKHLPVLAPLAVAAMINFAMHFNIYETWTWPQDRYNIAVLKYLIKQRHQTGKEIKLFVFWLNLPGCSYYTATEFTHTFPPFSYPTGKKERVPDDTTFDYYYVPAEHAGEVPNVYVPDTTFGDYRLMKKAGGRR